MRTSEKMKWVWVTGQTMTLRGRRRVRIHGRRILTTVGNYEEQLLLSVCNESPTYFVMVCPNGEFLISSIVKATVKCTLLG
jgi:hypothetical protein